MSWPIFAFTHCVCSRLVSSQLQLIPANGLYCIKHSINSEILSKFGIKKIRGDVTIEDEEDDARSQLRLPANGSKSKRGQFVCRPCVGSWAEQQCQIIPKCSKNGSLERAGQRVIYFHTENTMI